VKIDGDIQNLSSTGFDAGAFGFTTHFVINALPTTTGAETTMTVDGHVLTKMTAEAAAAEAAAPTTPATPPTTMPAAGTLEALVGHWVSSTEGVGDGFAVGCAEPGEDAVPDVGLAAAACVR
jgi:hypothetical protein